MTESPIYTPAHLQRVISTPTPTTPMPKIRSQTSMRARPVLAVGTSSQAISFLEKPSLNKNSSLIHPNVTPSTVQTFPEGLSPIGRHTRTPSTVSKRGYTRGPTMDDNSKADFSGILDLTTVKVTKTEQNSNIDEGGYIMLSQVPRPVHFKREGKRLQTSPDREVNRLDRSNSRIIRRPKMPTMEPLPPKEMAEIQSSFEKPLKNMQLEVKRYIERVRVLDVSDGRKLKEGGYSEGRNETAVISQEHALKVPGLTEEEKDRMRELDASDPAFFKKMEVVLLDCLKRMEREERLSQEVEFTEGRWISMETDRLEWRFCYIDVRGKAPPLRLMIKTGKEVKMLRVLASKKHRKPHKINSDFEFENKKFLKIYERDKNATSFENPFYYLAICPDESGFISIKIGFGELETERKIDFERKPLERAKTAMKVDPATLVMTPVQMEEFKKEVKEIKRYFRAKQLRLSGGIDRVAMNKMTEQYTPERVREVRGERTMKMQDLMMTAVKKKTDLLEQKQERDIAISKKREVQKALRGIMQDNQKQKNKKITIEKNWMATIAIYHMMTRIKQLKAAREKHYEIQARKMAVVTTMITKLRQKQMFRGKDIEERLTLDIRNALQFACLFSNAEIIKETQEKALMKFIMDIKEAWTIRSKFDAVIETMKKVQRCWREYARKKEGFKDLLSILWHKNYETVFQKIVAGEHNFNLIRLPNARALFKKISMKDFKNDELAREKFIDNYLLANRARYMKSYDHYDQHMSTIDKKERRKTQFIEILKAKPSLQNLDNNGRTKSGAGRTRMSIMQEIEQNSMRDIDSETPSMVIPGQPPKLFILPDKDDLESLLAKAMVNQAIVTLHRGGVTNIPVKK